MSVRIFRISLSCVIVYRKGRALRPSFSTYLYIYIMCNLNR